MKIHEYAGGAVIELLSGIIFLLLIAAAVRALTNRLRLPFSVVLVFVGIVIAYAAEQIPALMPPVQRFELSSEIILFLFLPTLIYESSQSMDVRALRKNLVPILTLAVPGLVLSTLIIGSFVALLTPLSYSISLLLGAILSATDPVAVIAIFKRLGAPKQLFVLIEGESLFNDATSLVLSRILVTLILGGSLGMASMGSALVDFLVVFLGGIGVGVLLGMGAGSLLGKVRTESFVIITITTVLAYLSFIIAEELFYVSGVMAVVAAGLSFSGWGWMKVTPPVRTYLEHFWEYAAFLANALIFLFVGLNVRLSEILGVLPILGWVIAGMLISRAMIIYGITPLVEFSSRQRIFRYGYKPVLLWGGLRGAVALAIVLSIPEFGQNRLLETLVIGSVLFTLFVEGLSIEPLVKLLGLHRPSRTDRFIIRQHQLEGKQMALERIDEFASQDVFSKHVVDSLKEHYRGAVKELQSKLETIRSEVEDEEMQRRILYSLTLSQELSIYMELFNNGHLGERAFRELQLDLANQFDRVRCSEELGHGEYGRFHPRSIEQMILALLELLPPLISIAEKRRRARLAINYEISWGHKEGSRRILEKIEELRAKGTFGDSLIEEIRSQYEHWHETACRHLDQTADQFPDFVQSVQHKLGERLALLTEQEYIEEQMSHGSLPYAFGEGLLEEIETELQQLRQQEMAHFEIDPTELLRKVSFFEHMGSEEFSYIAKHLVPMTVNEHELVIRQGEVGKSLFLITRGVVRVTRSERGENRELSSLFAGDVFGEMALLHGVRRSASVKAVTPCYLYELRRDALEQAMERFPHIREALRQMDAKRAAEQIRPDDSGR